jgi:hypothetical protein
LEEGLRKPLVILAMECALGKLGILGDFRDVDAVAVQKGEFGGSGGHRGILFTEIFFISLFRKKRRN